jgi:hypothetical protein
VAKNSLQALCHALAYATVHEEIAFDKLTQVSLRSGTSPELPVLNQLSPEDIAAFYAV